MKNKIKCYLDLFVSNFPSIDLRMYLKYLSPAKKLEFYSKVWEFVRGVPEGRVVTYGQIATSISPPNGVNAKTYRAFGPRWVGGAMAACPDDVPWHRVINAQGKISLRTGESSTLQQEILEEEGVRFDKNQRINLSEYQWFPIDIVKSKNGDNE